MQRFAAQPALEDGAPHRYECQSPEGWRELWQNHASQWHASLVSIWHADTSARALKAGTRCVRVSTSYPHTHARTRTRMYTHKHSTATQQQARAHTHVRARTFRLCTLMCARAHTHTRAAAALQVHSLNLSDKLHVLYHQFWQELSRDADWRVCVRPDRPNICVITTCLDGSVACRQVYLPCTRHPYPTNSFWGQGPSMHTRMCMH